jgi:putative FmdB family regulatory protein
MPTYDYECSACGHRFEMFQSITARPARKCVKCGRLKAKRLIGTGGGIIFKGSGFYETDYRSESYRKAAKADADVASGGKSDVKSDKSSDGTGSSGAKGGQARGGKPAGGK